jgi:hypothetical protein
VLRHQVSARQRPSSPSHESAKPTKFHIVQKAKKYPKLDSQEISSHASENGKTEKLIVFKSQDCPKYGKRRRMTQAFGSVHLDLIGAIFAPIYAARSNTKGA